MGDSVRVELKGVAHAHATLVVRELLRLGVGAFCVSPGARMIPLLVALEECPEANVKLFNDERSAAFYAQGFGKGGGLACLICTSGTASANYLPGVVEASMSRTPLLIITADRPFELLHARANQTIPQKQIFGSFVTEVFDIPAPDSRVFPRELLATIDSAVSLTRGSKQPVHLNIAYRKPFLETHSNTEFLTAAEQQFIGDYLQADSPLCTYSSSRLAPSEAGIESVLAQLATSKNPLLIAGPLANAGTAADIIKLAELLGAPVFADINSQLRFGTNSSNVFARYNLFLASLAASRTFPDCILYFGDRIVSEPLREYLAQTDLAITLVGDYLGRQDAIENEFLNVGVRLIGDVSVAVQSLSRGIELREPSAYFNSCTSAERQAANWDHAEPIPGSISAVSESLEARVVNQIFCDAPKGASIFLSSSLVFREAEYFVSKSQKPLFVQSNRGATGIDGILSSSLGVAGAQNALGITILGDQAMLHDLNALAVLAKSKAPHFVFLINNNGGAIFNFFNLGQHTQTLINPHPWSFACFAEGFGLEYFSPQSVEELSSSFQRAIEKQQSAVFEVKVNGAESVRFFKAAPVRGV